MEERFELERNKLEKRYDIVVLDDYYYITDKLIDSLGTRRVLELMLEHFKQAYLNKVNQTEGTSNES